LNPHSSRGHTSFTCSSKMQRKTKTRRSPSLTGKPRSRTSPHQAILLLNCISTCTSHTALFTVWGPCSPYHPRARSQYRALFSNGSIHYLLRVRTVLTDVLGFAAPLVCPSISIVCLLLAYPPPRTLMRHLSMHVSRSFRLGHSLPPFRCVSHTPEDLHVPARPRRRLCECSLLRGANSLLLDPFSIPAMKIYLQLMATLTVS